MFNLTGQPLESGSVYRTALFNPIKCPVCGASLAESCRLAVLTPELAEPVCEDCAKPESWNLRNLRIWWSNLESTKDWFVRNLEGLD